MKWHKCLYSSTPEEYTNWQKSLNLKLLYNGIYWNLNAIERARGMLNVEWGISPQFKCISYFGRRNQMQIYRKNLFFFCKNDYSNSISLKLKIEFKHLLKLYIEIYEICDSEYYFLDFLPDFLHRLSFVFPRSYLFYIRCRRRAFCASHLSHQI